jgi:hypothetical protein
MLLGKSDVLCDSFCRRSLELQITLRSDSPPSLQAARPCAKGQLYQAVHELEARQAKRAGEAAPLAHLDVQVLES